MKFQANRTELLALAKKLCAIAPASSVKLAQTCVYMEAQDDTVLFKAADDTMGLQLRQHCPVAQSGCALLPARLWCSILEHCADEATLIEQNTQLHVQNAQTLYTFPCMNPADFPKLALDLPPSLTEMNGWRTMDKLLTFCAAPLRQNATLHCVHLRIQAGRLLAESLDGHRIMQIELPLTQTVDFEALIPANALHTLAAIVGDAPCQVGITGAHILFLRPNMIFSVKRIGGKYFDTQTLFDRLQPAYRAQIGGAELYLAVSTLGASSAKTRLQLMLRPGEIQLKTENTGKKVSSSMTLSADVRTPTPLHGFCYSLPYFRECLQVMRGQLELAIDARGYLLLRGKEMRHLLLPMRTAGNHTKNAA